MSQTHIILSVPLATEPGISVIILTPIKILQRNLNRSTFVVWEIKRNVFVVRFKFRCKILISGKIMKEMPGSVASGTPCTRVYYKINSQCLYFGFLTCYLQYEPIGFDCFPVSFVFHVFPARAEVFIVPWGERFRSPLTAYHESCY